MPEGSINGMGKVIDVRQLIDAVKAEYKPLHDANYRLFEYLQSVGAVGMIESSCADTATTEIGRLASWNQQLNQENAALRIDLKQEEKQSSLLADERNKLKQQLATLHDEQRRVQLMKQENEKLTNWNQQLNQENQELKKALSTLAEQFSNKHRRAE